MEYRQLGNSGVRVSKLCLGTMNFGSPTDEPEAHRIIDTAIDGGINFIDTADVYARGVSEEFTGRALVANGKRDDVVLATKAVANMGRGPNDHGASRYHLTRAVENSLRRMETDRIDLFYLHITDITTPIEETLDTLNTLVRQGKILYPAASNFAAWQVAKGLGISAREGWAPFACIQPMYNLVKRQAEVELLPMARSENLGVITYSPLGGGLLTGKYGPQRRPEQGRLVENEMYQTRYGADWVYAVAGRFTRFALERGYDPVSLAVAWVAGHPAVTAPIIGARNLEQLAGSLGALEIEMTPELYTEIAALSPEPPPATDRSEERTAFTYEAQLSDKAKDQKNQKDQSGPKRK